MHRRQGQARRNLPQIGELPRSRIYAKDHQAAKSRVHGSRHASRSDSDFSGQLHTLDTARLYGSFRRNDGTQIPCWLSESCWL
jgi:hypothetical protein